MIEQIYAGPQGSFVPKTFSPGSRFSSLTDLGFVVVQVDGMGTANRSKAFHDVCWHNIKDAGFPDRILWHQAIGKKYAWYDLNRVGIYGTSAGGQNATAGVLFHPEFYKVAASACGCHDNRMDKASWNEQWMGYPVGPWYSESSNIDNAHRLQGKLMLIVGEMDTNVPPESTMRLVDALIKAGKDFDLLVVPNANHGMGGAYGQRRMNDFFVRNLLGAAPASTNSRPDAEVVASQGGVEAASAPFSGPSPHSVHPGTLDMGDLANDGSELAARSSATRSTATASCRRRHRPRRRRQDGRVREFNEQWLHKLEKLEFDRLTPDGKIDYVLFKNYLSHQLRQLGLRSKERELAAPLVPFAQKIIDLDAARREVKSMEWSKVASSLDSLAKEIGSPGALSNVNPARETRSNVRPPIERWHRSRTCATRSAAGTAFMTDMTLFSPGGCKSRTRESTKVCSRILISSASGWVPSRRAWEKGSAAGVAAAAAVVVADSAAGPAVAAFAAGRVAAPAAALLRLVEDVAAQRLRAARSKGTPEPEDARRRLLVLIPSEAAPSSVTRSVVRRS